jgi:peptidoglycan/xylan/chitin deacetylase (PgdA/CDA1 family)
VSHPLIEADARANLCFHDIADDPSVIYTLPMSYLLAVTDGLRAQGIADRVRIYFDDGYASVVEAVHTLKARAPEIEIVVALTLSFLEQPGHIGWSDVEALHRDGVRITAHGREHLHMDQLTDEQILVQLTESRDALAPYGTDEFVLPFGSYNDTVLAVNDSHGLFSVLTTVDYGWDHGQPLRPRLVVTSEITPAEVITRLANPD